MHSRLTDTQSRAAHELNARLLAFSRERRAILSVCRRCGTDPRFVRRAILSAAHRAGVAS